MREDIERLISTRINDVVKLELALFFQQNQQFVDRAECVALRVKRDARTVQDALRSLADGGIIERFELGEGRYILYSYTRDPNMRDLLDGLSALYHEDPAQRMQIVKRLMGVAR